MKDIIIGNTPQRQTETIDELKDEEAFKQAFSQFKDEEGRPKSLDNLTIGEPDTSAQFSNKSVKDLVDQINSK